MIDARWECLLPPGNLCTPKCGNGRADLNIPLNWNSAGTATGPPWYEECDYTSSSVEYDRSDLMFLTDKFKTCCTSACQWDTTYNYLGPVVGQVIFRELWKQAAWDTNTIQ